MRRLLPLISFALLGVCLGLAGLHAKPRLSFFCEVEGEQFQQLSLDSMLVRDLQAMGAELRVGLLDLSEARADAIMRFNRAGIPVVAWLLLPEAEGYWFHADNGDQAAARYAEFQAWTERYGLRWQGVGIDIEFPIDDARDLWRAPLRTLLAQWPRLYDDEGIPAGRARYAALVEQMRQDGYRVETYVIPLILDERAAGTESLQRYLRLLDIPADREIPMCYTSAGLAGGASILSYGPEGTAVAIGSTGGGVTLGEGQVLPSLTWEDLSRDLLLAQQVNAAEIHIFSLEGCLQKDWLPRLRDFDFNQPVFLYSGEIEAMARQRRVTQVVLKLLSWPTLTVLGLGLTLLLALWLVWRLLSWPFRRRRKQRAAAQADPTP